MTKILNSETTNEIVTLAIVIGLTVTLLLAPIMT